MSKSTPLPSPSDPAQALAAVVALRLSADRLEREAGASGETASAKNSD